MTLNTTVERELKTIAGDDEFQEVAVVVEFSCYGASRGARDKWGAPLEPDEDEGVEIESVTDETGKEVELIGDEEERIEQACLKLAKD